MMLVCLIGVLDHLCVVRLGGGWGVVVVQRGAPMVISGCAHHQLCATVCHFVCVRGGGWQFRSVTTRDVCECVRMYMMMFYECPKLCAQSCATRCVNCNRYQTPHHPAGFFASACSLPFDFVKTRMQKMTPNADGRHGIAPHSTGTLGHTHAHMLACMCVTARGTARVCC